MASGFIQNLKAGLVVPDTAELKTEVQSEWVAALGDGLRLDDETPQGRLIDNEVTSRAKLLESAAYVVNNFNPNFAGGVFLDALLNLTGSERKPATKTTVTANVTGLFGTVIPAGARARTENNDFFELVNGVIIPVGNTAVAEFAAIESGSVACPPLKLNSIVDAVVGWETIENPLSGITGIDEMSDSQARVYRLQTLGGFGSASIESIKANIYKVDGVFSAFPLENVQSTPAVIRGVTVAAHTTEWVVQGGSDIDVATAIYEKHSNGGLQGDQNIIVAPDGLPSFDVYFSRPAPVAVYIRITLKLSGVSNIGEQVRAAVIDYSRGLYLDEEGFSVGKPIYAAELAPPVSEISRASDVVHIEVREKYAGVFSHVLDVAPKQIGVIESSADIEIIIV